MTSGITDKKVKLFTLGSYATQTYYIRITDTSRSTQSQAIVTFINRNTSIYTNVLCKYGNLTLKLYAKKEGNNMIIYTDLAGITYPVIFITRISYSIGNWDSRFNMEVDDDADISSMIDISI